MFQYFSTCSHLPGAKVTRKCFPSRPIYDLQAQIQRRVLGVPPKTNKNTSPPPKKNQTNKQTNQKQNNKKREMHDILYIAFIFLRIPVTAVILQILGPSYGVRPFVPPPWFCPVPVGDLG